MEHTLTKQADTVEVILHGDLTFADHEQFRTILFALADSPESKNIVINVKGVNFIDSAGIGMLIIAHDESKDRHQQLTIRGARDQVKAALDIADLKSLIKLVD